MLRLQEKRARQKMVSRQKTKESKAIEGIAVEIVKKVLPKCYLIFLKGSKHGSF